MNEPDPLDDDAFVLRRLRARARRGALVHGTLGLLVVTGALLGLELRVELQSFLRGEIDLRGNARYTPPHPERSARDGSIDWAEVHGELIPRWMMRHARQSEYDAETRDQAHAAYQELRYALAPDHNAVSLFDELEEHLREDPVGRARRIDYLLWAYNHYLDRNEVPWRLEATMRHRARRDVRFLTRSYEVLSDLRSVRGHRVRLLRRADLTNIEEGFLGHASRRGDGALIMLDQVLQFAVQRLWPLLSAALDGRLPAEQRRLGPHVRREVMRALRPAHLRLLEETAVDQRALVEVADSIHARERCGNTFRIWGLPWDGLAAPDQRALVEALERSQGHRCPQVTLPEAARLIGASERLGSTPALADAVEALALFAAKAVAIHELRHVADGRRVECQGCEGLSPPAREELSAYLASFADEDIGYTALLQACAAQPDELVVSQAPHAQALAIAFAEVLPEGCSGPVPEDLAGRAREASARHFGSRESVTLPERFPQRLRMLPRSGSDP